MKYRTPKKERATYLYTGKDAKLTLRPGEDGITEADIASRHRSDDDDFNNDKKHSRTDRKIVKQIIPLAEGYAEMAEAINGFDPTFDAFMSSENQRIVREAITQLPEKQAKAVTAVWLEGITPTEYAKIAGMTQSGVTHLLNRAFKNLRKIFLAKYGEKFF